MWYVTSAFEKKNVSQVVDVVEIFKIKNLAYAFSFYSKQIFLNLNK